ncbi:hypothetical protein C1886_22710 [Pseudomonas sp. FW300-N1A1]|nr:hypothetical protein C1886_22710 [Pseudomonas sp. FW300-N1A1]
MLALGCTAAPTAFAEFALKDRSRFVGSASRTSASKLARHGSLTCFKRFLTEQHDYQGQAFLCCSTHSP